MEHKLIDGGAEYLPFARSRIKAMRATGLAYASQQYQINGVNVKTRICGEHDYITVNGGTGKVLSGMVRNGTIIFNSRTPGLGPDVLNSFKPTQQAWTHVMRRKPSGTGPTVFSENAQLAVETSVLLSAQIEAVSQNQGISASMYTGSMAALVQFLQGCGKLKGVIDPDILANGIQVKYRNIFNDTDGITFSTSGHPWLVKISLEHGLLAMPLPIFENKEIDVNDKTDVVRE